MLQQRIGTEQLFHFRRRGFQEQSPGEEVTSHPRLLLKIVRCNRLLPPFPAAARRVDGGAWPCLSSRLKVLRWGVETVNRAYADGAVSFTTGSQEVGMPRTTRTITFSLPPEMADRVDEAMKRQGGSRSEFLREVLLRHLEECEWRQLLQNGEERGRERGIGPEDVVALVDEYRAEVNASRP